MALSEAQRHVFRQGYLEEVDPNNRDRARSDSAVHLHRSIERLKLFAGVEKFRDNQHALDVLECFREVFLESQYRELREYFDGSE